MPQGEHEPTAWAGCSNGAPTPSLRCNVLVQCSFDIIRLDYQYALHSLGQCGMRLNEEQSTKEPHQRCVQHSDCPTISAFAFSRHGEPRPTSRRSPLGGVAAEPPLQLLSFGRCSAEPCGTARLLWSLASLAVACRSQYGHGSVEHGPQLTRLTLDFGAISRFVGSELLPYGSVLTAL